MARFCIFALFLVVIFQFGNCDIDCDNITVKPGSNETTLSHFEKWAKKLKLSVDKVEDGIKKKIIGDKSKSPENSIAVFLEPEDFETFRAIFPGTLWCGDGDIAKQESDLGYFNKTDACCRAHDNCNDDLLAGQTKGNLENNGIFTRSACNCDDEFYRCLKNADTLISNSIGKTYFNILKPQCYTCQCPTVDCKVTDRLQCEKQCKLYKWQNSPKY
ncbi:phospholipase A2-like [Pseudomyrmex gracilis]|uniref:phospholipase A2-like n=1 Tax=Pseudomyrmex gracilis TaxID=219809 RepID=UPI000995C5C0|nr:phospholipase A2-like [Pseudomyrmex gracilis]